MPRKETPLRGILHDFCYWTSTQGVPHIGLAENIWLRIFWTVVTGACFAVCIFFLVDEFRKFFQYPVKLETALETGERDFPSVTFCNSNPWKRSMVEGTPLEGLLNAYLRNGSNDEYGFDYPGTTEKDIRARNWMRLMSENLIEMDKAGANISYGYDELFMKCTYNSRPCDDFGNFTEFYDAYNGRCFIFNPNGNIKSSRASPLYGLRVIMRSDRTQYLPWVQTVGAVVFVHGTEETPFQDAFGQLVPTGTVSAIGARYLKRTKLGRPYSQCTNENSTQMIYYDHKYEVEACVRSCLQDRIVAECRCYDPQFRIPNPPTSPQSQISCFNVTDKNAAIDCAQAIMNNNGTGKWNPYTDCDCPTGCDQSYYKVTMSTAQWPAKKYIPPGCQNISIMQGYWKSRDDCFAWYRENTMVVEVYFERSSIQVMTEMQGYKYLEFLGNAGGQLGLWLGMSAVSVVEILIFFVILIVYAIIRPGSAKNVNRVGSQHFEYWDSLEKDGVVEKGSNIAGQLPNDLQRREQAAAPPAPPKHDIDAIIKRMQDKQAEEAEPIPIPAATATRLPTEPTSAIQVTRPLQPAPTKNISIQSAVYDQDHEVPLPPVVQEPSQTSPVATSPPLLLDPPQNAKVDKFIL